MKQKFVLSAGVSILAMVLMILPTFETRAQSQPQELIVVVEDNGPSPRLPIIDVTVDGKRRRVAPGRNGRLEASFPRGNVGRAVIGVTYRRGGSAQMIETAQQEFVLNGSGFIRIRRLQNGEIVIDQYATIILAARPERLKLKFNGDDLGETEWRDGFVPDKEHEFVWVNAKGKSVCKMKKTFPPGITRRYTCVDRQPPVIEVS